MLYKTIATVIIAVIGLLFPSLSASATDPGSNYIFSPEIDQLLELHDKYENDILHTDSAYYYTIEALKLIQQKYGIESEEYVNIFSDYMIPDAMNNKEVLVNELYPFVLTEFDPDSPYIWYAYYILGKALTLHDEYRKANYLFEQSAEVSPTLYDRLKIEIEKAINWRNQTNGVMYYLLSTPLEESKKLSTPQREEIQFRIYYLLAKYYTRLYKEGYPDSPLGFIKMAEEMIDYASDLDKLELTVLKHQLLLESDHQSAIESLEKALTIYKDYDIDNDLAEMYISALIVRGDYCLNELSNEEHAFKYYSKAINIANNPDINLDLRLLLLSRLHTVAKKSEMYEAAVSSGEALVLRSLERGRSPATLGYVIDLANTYIDIGNIKKAKTFLNQFIVDLNNCKDIEYDWNFLKGTLCILDNQPKEALDIFTKLYNNSPDDLSRLHVAHPLSKIYGQLKHPASRQLSDSINAISKRLVINKLWNLTSSERNVWIELCNASFSSQMEFIDQGKAVLNNAAELNLFRKSLLFRTNSQIATLLNSDNSTKIQLDSLNILKANLKSSELYVNSSITDSLRNKLENKERTLYQSIVSQNQLLDKINISLKKVISNLRATDLAIDFVRYSKDNKYYYGAFVFSSNLAPKYINILETSKESEQNDITLHKNKIWNKLIPYMSKYKDIYFCLDGYLNGLPVESTLIDDKPINHKYNLHRVFHLADIKPDGGIGKNVVAVGVSDHNSPIGEGETMDRGNWTDLPEVKYELELIKSRLPEQATTIIFNDDAREKSIKDLSNSNVSTLHFSTHGFYRNSDSLIEAASDSLNFDFNIARRALSAKKTDLSGLVLRQGNISWKAPQILDEEDDLLTSDEIETMNFPDLNLTVLSACDTGLGSIDSDGVWGLQRAFRIAGSKSIICTLNKVNDYWTSQFMDLFYEHAAKGESIYDSFQYAQKSLYKSEPDSPEIWSSFILIE